MKTSLGSVGGNIFRSSLLATVMTTMERITIFSMNILESSAIL